MKNLNIVKDSVTIKKLTSENSAFSFKNGFVTLTLNEDGETREFNKITLHRAFPFELLWEYLSVLDSENNEIGIIYKLTDFDEETAELLKTELLRKYYEPKIKTVISLKERYGFSYWNVITTDDRNVNFTMQDTFRNIIRIGQDRVVLLDVDGNRFVIESVLGLDRKSYKKIELYL